MDKTTHLQNGGTCNELEIAEIVIDAARAIFEQCGAPKDFCIQSIGMDCIVFGGSNRVIWGPRSGFRPDKSYCSPRFMAAFFEIQ